MSNAQPEKKWIEVRNVTAEAADVFLYGSIGMTDSAAEALAQLRSLKVKTINVRINSPGGSVYGGLAVYNALVQSDADIVTHVDGLAASIASVIAMAGDRIVMAENAMLMIHAPSSTASGGSEELRIAADVLEKLHANLAEIYRKRSGQSPEAIAELMAADSWLSASAARALGLCTEIAPSRQIEASFDLSAFKNVPAQFANSMSKPESAEAKPGTEAAAATAATNSETFTAEAVTAKVQAAERAASEAAHAAAKVALDAAKTEALAQLNNLRAELTGKITAKDTEIADLKAKLKDAEALSAANLGAPPVAHVVTSSGAGAKKTPGTPAEILTHWRSLRGSARQEFFNSNTDAIWAAHDAEMAAGSR